MFYKARAPSGNERVPAWKTNKENEGEKSTVEKGIHSSFPKATGPRSADTFLAHVCVL